MTPKQIRCIELLGCGTLQKDIAKELNVTERTIQRWQTLSEFKSALEGISYRPVAVSAVEVVNTNQARRDRLERLADASIDVLEGILRSDEARTSDKIRACQIIGTWSGVDKPKNLDLVEIFESLLGLELLPAESVETVVASYLEMRKAMKEALKRG